MLDILIKDILPIFVIMFLGYVAGKKGVFKTEDSKVLNKLVLTYALPAAFMGVFALLIPKNATWLFPGIFLCIIVYFFALILVRFFTKEDIESLRKLSLKTGRLLSISNKLLDFVERIEFRNK